MSNKERTRLDAIRSGQKDLLKNILLTSLAGGTALYGGTKLLEMFGEDYSKLKHRKDPVFLPSKGQTTKREVGGMDKFSQDKSALFSGDDIEDIDLIDASPYTIPLAILAAGGGIYGGYKGADYLYNILKNKEHKGNIGDIDDENRRLLRARYELAKRSVQDRIDSAFDKYLESKNKGMKKQALLGTVGGTALTLGGLLWLIAHNKMKNYMLGEGKDANRFKKLKNKLEHTDLNQAAVGNYMTLDKPRLEEDEELKENLKTAATMDFGVNPGYTAINNLNDENMAELQDYAKINAQTAANDPTVGDAISKPFVDNKAQVVGEVRKAVKDKMNTDVPDMFKSNPGASANG